jgi:hypothetical protein
MAPCHQVRRGLPTQLRTFSLTVDEAVNGYVNFLSTGRVNFLVNFREGNAQGKSHGIICRGSSFFWWWSVRRRIRLA